MGVFTCLSTAQSLLQQQPEQLAMHFSRNYRLRTYYEVVFDYVLLLMKFKRNIGVVEYTLLDMLKKMCPKPCLSIRPGCESVILSLLPKCRTTSLPAIPLV
jgi:hypothetical protein